MIQPTFVSGGIMESYPTTRFARLRHDLPGQQHVTTTFLGASATADAALANNGVIAEIAASDPARAQLVTSRMQQLIAHNDAVMAWIEADPSHAVQFAQDPVAALRQVIPDLPADFFDGWGPAGESG
jgi:hypothetical protein